MIRTKLLPRQKDKLSCCFLFVCLGVLLLLLLMVCVCVCVCLGALLLLIVFEGVVKRY